MRYTIIFLNASKYLIVSVIKNIDKIDDKIKKSNQSIGRLNGFCLSAKNKKNDAETK
tara:strand:+ start:221 stop:391 length:171 start_codon:yes stop_codon:yes gene_type:complete